MTPEAPVTPKVGTDHGELPGLNVTSPAGPLSAAERKRRQRERERNAEALIYERSDWQLFCDPASLPQKAGCLPHEIAVVVLKELVDNALDHDPDGEVELRHEGKWWIVTDTGPGIAPEQVPKLFCVNRPLLSSKLRRLPLRGMLGNGLRVVMGAVAATNGKLVVETRGHRFELGVDRTTGLTRIVSDADVPARPGTIVRVKLDNDLGGTDRAARIAICLAPHGRHYDGPSSPHWYGPRDLLRLFASVMPSETMVGEVCRDLGFPITDNRCAKTLTLNQAAGVLDRLRREQPTIPPGRLGFIGPDAYDMAYCRREGEGSISGARIPYVVEAWADCDHPLSRGNGKLRISLLLNRTLAIAAHLVGSSDASGITVRGCGMLRGATAPTGDYQIILSLIVPYVQLTGDGKTPDLTPFGAAIIECVRRACSQAHRLMDRPADKLSIKDAAWQVMAEAYLAASAGGTLPANARQIMYAARPRILALIGKEKLNDKYFTQTLLPDYVEEHPDECADLEVVFDARGAFAEPHTGREVPLGTIEVRQYLGQRPAFGRAVELRGDRLFPTSGPEHRYRNVLFVEKEGFGPLLAHANIAAKFDIAIMSTKGMSVTAARLLLDQIAPHLDRVLVLHDFDVTGFSIFGTLGTTGRRYTFENDVTLIDLGLRLADVEAMGLQCEPVEVKDFDARIDTLARHGATPDEIEFLREARVELNAMDSRQFIDFVERKLTENGVAKVLPDQPVLEQCARRVLERIATEQLVESVRAEIEADTESRDLPDDLRARVAAALQRDPTLPWDLAVADCIRSTIDEGGNTR